MRRNSELSKKMLEAYRAVKEEEIKEYKVQIGKLDKALKVISRIEIALALSLVCLLGYFISTIASVGYLIDPLLSLCIIALIVILGLVVCIGFSICFILDIWICTKREGIELIIKEHENPEVN